jgi:2-polyprenyl-3-methyl-5-hydroxy-6-metoxy-1,4-benzoquinol methylase
MNYRERFLEIKNFLKHYQNIWQNEIMLDYPEPLKHYPHDWLEDLGQFQDKNDLIQIEKKDVLSFINNPSLRIFYQTIARLSDLPHKESSPPIQENHWTWLYMIPKKQHEIRLLAPHVNNLYLEQAIDQVIDVGGGIGLLAQTLNNTYGHKVISIDKDLSLQQTGILRHQKN